MIWPQGDSIQIKRNLPTTGTPMQHSHSKSAPQKSSSNAQKMQKNGQNLLQGNEKNVGLSVILSPCSTRTPRKRPEMLQAPGGKARQIMVCLAALVEPQNTKNMATKPQVTRCLLIAAEGGKNASCPSCAFAFPKLCILLHNWIFHGQWKC